MVKAARSPAAVKPPSKPRAPSAAKAAKPKSTTRGAAKPTSPSTRKAAATKAAPRGRAASVKPSARSTRTTPAKTAPAKATAKPATKQAPGAASQCAPINLGYLSSFVGFHLRLAQDASYRAFARIKEKDMVKPGRYPALAIIHLNPGISQSALGRAIARDKSTVSPLIKDLQKNGLINRKPSPNDRRSVTLVLTKKGERVLDRLHARALEHEDDLDKLLGATKSRLVGMLDKITGGLAAA